MKATKTLFALAMSLGLAGTTAGAQDIEYTLTNNTSSTLLEFYTSPVDVEDWENDLLAELDVEPGESVGVLIGDGRTQCAYDLLFLFDDGSEVTDTVDICELASYELTE